MHKLECNLLIRTLLHCSVNLSELAIAYRLYVLEILNSPGLLLLCLLRWSLGVATRTCRLVLIGIKMMRLSSVVKKEGIACC